MFKLHHSLILASLLAFAAPALAAQDSRPAPVAAAAAKGKTVELELKAEDGQRVPGWFRSTAKLSAPDLSLRGTLALRKATPAVVLLHMYRSDHTAWKSILDDFEAAGIATLAIDMRGHGSNTKGPQGEDLAKRSADRDPVLFNEMWMDALAAVTWLREQGYAPGNIGLLGASVGCSVAIDAARRTDSLTKVAVMTPGVGYLGVDTVEQLGQWGRRDLLILTSSEEAPGGPAPLRDQLAKQFEQTKKKHPDMASRISYWEYEQKSIHGTRMFGKVDGVEARIVGWFAQRFEADAKKLKAAGGDSLPKDQ